MTRRRLLLRPLERPTRLDRALAALLEGEHSRTVVAAWIREGRVSLDGMKAKSAQLVHGGEEVVLEIPAPPPVDLLPEPIPIRVVFEDETLLVVDKPAGLVTHPAGPLRSGTLVNALLHHAGTLSAVGGEMRPGIVHRLDKGTSGLLVVAKTDEAHRRLSKALRDRTVSRIYEAIAWGRVRPESFEIDAPIARDPRDRKRMAVVEGGKEARSRVRVLASLPIASRLEIALDTGRTHQIRVHLAHRRHPVVGDVTYGGRRLPVFPSASLRAAAVLLLAAIDRPALHARELRFRHPFTEKELIFSSPLPEDFERALRAMGEADPSESANFR